MVERPRSKEEIALKAQSIRRTRQFQRLENKHLPGDEKQRRVPVNGDLSEDIVAHYIRENGLDAEVKGGSGEIDIQLEAGARNLEVKGLGSPSGWNRFRPQNMDADVAVIVQWRGYFLDGDSYVEIYVINMDRVEEGSFEGRDYLDGLEPDDTMEIDAHHDANSMPIDAEDYTDQRWSATGDE